jgi:hypothetical protein
MIPDNPSSGAGSGGGPDTKVKHQDTDGTFSISANQVVLLSRPTLAPVVPDPYVISIMAIGTGLDGLVNVRGSQGVRLTAGTVMLPPTTTDSTNGVEIMVSETQNVTIQRGLLPVDQKIEMTPEGITIDAGMGAITIQSLTQIKLSVCGGLSSITLGPDGVTITGLPLVKIN